MGFFNPIKRFAGTALENINTGYNAVDNQFGGILPGGTEFNPVDTLKEVARDALPGHRVHGEKTAGFIANSGKDVFDGRVDLTTTRTQSGKYAGKAREHLVEEGVEQIGKRIGKKVGLASLGPVGAGLAVIDTANDIRDGVNVVSEIATGKDYDTHIDETIQMRDDKYNPLTNLFPSASSNYLSTNAYQADGTPHVMGQGSSENAIAREIKTRAHQLRNRFNPAQMDFGFSEIMGWN